MDCYRFETIFRRAQHHTRARRLFRLIFRFLTDRRFVSHVRFFFFQIITKYPDGGLFDGVREFAGRAPPRNEASIIRDARPFRRIGNARIGTAGRVRTKRIESKVKNLKIFFFSFFTGRSARPVYQSLVSRRDNGITFRPICAYRFMAAPSLSAISRWPAATADAYRLKSRNTGGCTISVAYVCSFIILLKTHDYCKKKKLLHNLIWSNSLKNDKLKTNL